MAADMSHLALSDDEAATAEKEESDFSDSSILQAMEAPSPPESGRSQDMAALNAPEPVRVPVRGGMTGFHRVTVDITNEFATAARGGFTIMAHDRC